jgi:hypothetical protein
MKHLLIIRKPEDDTSSSSLIFELYENQILAIQRQEFINLNYPEFSVAYHEVLECDDVFRELQPRPKSIDSLNMESVTYLNQEPKQ